MNWLLRSLTTVEEVTPTRARANQGLAAFAFAHPIRLLRQQ